MKKYVLVNLFILLTGIMFAQEERTYTFHQKIEQDYSVLNLKEKSKLHFVKSNEDMLEVLTRDSNIVLSNICVLKGDELSISTDQLPNEVKVTLYSSKEFSNIIVAENAELIGDSIIISKENNNPALKSEQSECENGKYGIISIFLQGNMNIIGSTNSYNDPYRPHLGFSFGLPIVWGKNFGEKRGLRVGIEYQWSFQNLNNRVFYNNNSLHLISDNALSTQNHTQLIVSRNLNFILCYTYNKKFVIGFNFTKRLKTNFWDFSINQDGKTDFNSNRLSNFNSWKIEPTIRYRNSELYFNILPEYKNDKTRTFGVRLYF